MPFEEGNKIRQKGEQPATSWLQVRVVPRDKAGWVKAACVEGKNLSEWVVVTLNNAAKKKEQQRPVDAANPAE